MNKKKFSEVIRIGRKLIGRGQPAFIIASFFEKMYCKCIMGVCPVRRPS